MAKPTDLVVTAEKANLAHLRQARELVASIKERKISAARSFYEIGSALLELEQKRLWAVLGHDSLMKLVEAEALMSASQARKLMEVTRRYSRENATALGPDLAYAVARHVERTKAKDSVADILARGFPVNGRRKPIGEVSVREVLRATRSAVEKQQGRHGESARARRDAEAAARTARRTLSGRGLRDADVRLEFAGGQWLLVVRLPAARTGTLLG
jgi:hypothetical protein